MKKTHQQDYSSIYDKVVLMNLTKSRLEKFDIFGRFTSSCTDFLLEVVLHLNVGPKFRMHKC